MEQRILEVNGIVSKPWDFEAMCRVDDLRDEGKGKLVCGTAAVAYLFEGSAVTGKAIDNLSTPEMSKLAFKCYKWYSEDLSEAIKNA